MIAYMDGVVTGGLIQADPSALLHQPVEASQHNTKIDLASRLQ